MSNEVKITDLVSPSAYQQLQKLQTDIEAAAATYAKFGDIVVEHQKSMDKSVKTMQEFDKAVVEQSKNEAKLNNAKAALIQSENRLTQAIDKQAAIARKKIAEEDKAEKAAERAAARKEKAAKQEKKDSENSIVDARSAPNTSVARALDAAAAALSFMA